MTFWRATFIRFMDSSGNRPQTSQSFHLNQSLPRFGTDPRRQVPWSGRIGWPGHGLLPQWLSVDAAYTRPVRPFLYDAVWCLDNLRHAQILTSYADRHSGRSARISHESLPDSVGRNSPPDTGGVAAASRKRREASLTPQTGWSVRHRGLVIAALIPPSPPCC